MSTVEQSKPPQTYPRIKRIVIFAGIVIVAFLAGLVPMWFKAWGRANERDAAQHELRLCNMQLTLASATISARRGEYEAARQATSDFFTALSGQLEPTSGMSDFTSPQRDGLKLLLAGRDELITLLARGDPASADRMSDLYTAYQKVIGKPQS